MRNEHNYARKLEHSIAMILSTMSPTLQKVCRSVVQCNGQMGADSSNSVNS